MAKNENNTPQVAPQPYLLETTDLDERAQRTAERQQGKAQKKETKQAQRVQSRAEKKPARRREPSKNPYTRALTGGLLLENPVLRLMLGICPTLAVTTTLFNGVAMGAATTIVLICSGILVSILRRMIPSQVRIASQLVIIATFATLVQLVMQAFMPSLADALGIYLSLVTVNCIILGQTERFASHNPPVLSALNSLGTGIGFTLVLALMGAVRELFGSGALAGIALLPEGAPTLRILLQPPGGFAVLGCLMALSVFLQRKMGYDLPATAMGCDGCAAQAGSRQQPEAQPLPGQAARGMAEEVGE